MVAGVDFKPPVQSCCFGDKHEVDAEDLATAFTAPSHCPLSPPVEVSPSTPLHGIAHHHHHPPMPAEVDGNVENPGSNGTVGDDSAGD